MTTLRKTTATARQIGVPPSMLLGWIRHGLLSAPQRDDSGHYLFDEDDIAAACRLRDQRRARAERHDPLAIVAAVAAVSQNDLAPIR